MDKDQALINGGGKMPHGSVLLVGLVLAGIVCVAAIGYVMVDRGVVGLCGPATFCRGDTFCVCPEYYAPVLGIPNFRVYSNACFACSDNAWMWIRI